MPVLRVARKMTSRPLSLDRHELLKGEADESRVLEQCKYVLLRGSARVRDEMLVFHRDDGRHFRGRRGFALNRGWSIGFGFFSASTLPNSECLSLYRFRVSQLARCIAFTDSE